MSKNLQAMKMEDIQKVSLEILKFVANICDREGIRYCLMYGTLIGAIRHGGYIPWDDDVDIMMPRTDYEKFLKYAALHPEEFGPYEIFNRSTNKDYLYAITRVSDNRYLIEKEDEENCGMGIFIDIYPYDGLGDDKENALELLQNTRRICNKICEITRKKNAIPYTLNYKGKINYIIRHIISKLRGIDYYISQLSANVSGFSFDSSKYVGPAMWFFTKPENVLFDKSLFQEMIKMPFEDTEFYVPAEYDKLLTQEYGNYMELPPEDKRIYHHQYKAYRKE